MFLVLPLLNLLLVYFTLLPLPVIPVLVPVKTYQQLQSILMLNLKDSEDGEISDSEVAEQNEEMNYRETVRAVRAFLGWSHIPDFEFSVADGNRSNNPWKGKHPRKSGKVSVELPADDWLCHKMEKLNTRVAEDQFDETDQFVRTPKSQSKWYKQYRLRQDTNVPPGKTIFSWSDSEAHLNAQFLGLPRCHLTHNRVLLLDQSHKTSCVGGRSVPEKGPM